MVLNINILLYTRFNRFFSLVIIITHHVIECFLNRLFLCVQAVQYHIYQHVSVTPILTQCFVHTPNMFHIWNMLFISKPNLWVCWDRSLFIAFNNGMLCKFKVVIIHPIPYNIVGQIHHLCNQLCSI